MTRRALSILGLMAFLLAACGGGPSKIEVVTTDFAFTPTNWTIKAGQPVEFTITNNGTLEHEWVLFKLGESLSVPFDADDEPKIFWELEAQPGETKTETFTAPTEPGTYQVACGIPEHFEKGMQGTLIVEK